MDTGLNEDETELGVLVTAVALKVLADSHGLLDKHVQIFGDLCSEALKRSAWVCNGSLGRGYSSERYMLHPFTGNISKSAFYNSTATDSQNRRKISLSDPGSAIVCNFRIFL